MTKRNTPRRCHPIDDQLWSLNSSSPRFSSFGTDCLMLCFFLHASLSTPLLSSVYSASICVVVSKVACIRPFCDDLNDPIYCRPHVTVLKQIQNCTARIPYSVVSPRFPSLSPADATAKPMASQYHITPSSPNLISFGVACVKLCCLPPAFPNTRCCVSFMFNICGRYTGHFAVGTVARQRMDSILCIKHSRTKFVFQVYLFSRHNLSSIPL